MVPSGAARSLEAGEGYGIWWFGQRQVSRRKYEDEAGRERERWRTKTRDRSEWLAVAVPWSGVEAETVERARRKLRDATTMGKPSKAGDRMRPRLTQGRAYYICSRAHNRSGCDARTNHRAEKLERAVMLAVDDLLSDPERIARDVDAAIENEKDEIKDAGAAARVLETEIQSIADQRRGFQKQQARGLINMDQLKSDKARAEAELAKVRASGQRLAELKARWEAALAMFGTGLAIGLQWLTPGLRAELYQALCLRALTGTGSPGPGCDPDVTLEGELDANAVRYTEALAEYAERLAGADKPYASVEELEAELSRVRSDSMSRRGARA